MRVIRTFPEIADIYIKGMNRDLDNIICLRDDDTVLYDLLKSSKRPPQISVHPWLHY